MFWLFAFGIIALCVFHEGFRKLVLALIAGTAVVILCIVMYSSQEASEHKAQAAAEIARAEAERAKLPECGPIDLDIPASLTELADHCRIDQTKLPKCPDVANDDPDIPYAALHNCRSNDPFGDALKQPADDADIPASLTALANAEVAASKKTKKHPADKL